MQARRQIEIKVSWCMGHRLSHGYEGPCSNIHGHNYEAIFGFRASQLNKYEFVIDFKEIESCIKDWLDEHFDHKLLISCEDPLRKILKDLPGYVEFSYNPTAERIAQKLFDQFTHFSDIENWPHLEYVEVKETPKYSALYWDEYEV